MTPNTFPSFFHIDSATLITEPYLSLCFATISRGMLSWLPLWRTQLITVRYVRHKGFRLCGNTERSVLSRVIFEKSEMLSIVRIVDGRRVSVCRSNLVELLGTSFLWKCVGSARWPKLPTARAEVALDPRFRIESSSARKVQTSRSGRWFRSDRQGTAKKADETWEWRGWDDVTWALHSWATRVSDVCTPLRWDFSLSLRCVPVSEWVLGIRSLFLIILLNHLPQEIQILSLCGLSGLLLQSVFWKKLWCVHFIDSSMSATSSPSQILPRNETWPRRFLVILFPNWWIPALSFCVFYHYTNAIVNPLKHSPNLRSYGVLPSRVCQ